MGLLDGAKRYAYRDMKGLTFWTCLFIIGRLVGVSLYVLSLACQLISGHILDLAGPDTTDPFDALAILAMIIYYVTYLVSGITSLVWIYGAARNALAMKPGMDFTPWGAVAWFFVPIANLFKPYQTLKLMWIASGGKVVANTEPRQVQGWWVFSIIGNIVLGVVGRLSNAISGGPVIIIATIAGLGLIAVGTWLFLKLVRAIQALQQGADTRVADAF